MSSKNTSFPKRKFQCGELVLDFSTPVVMGILNLTPDSFYEASRFQQEKEIIPQVEKMLADGAGLIDLGAVSTRPGAESIPAGEEQKRISKPLEQLVKSFPETIFSIDTYRADTARICVEAGASMVNDISGGQFDGKMFETVAKLNVPYVLMHLQGKPKDMQHHPLSQSAAQKVRHFFTEKVAQLNEMGMKDIILDPGFGFGKTLGCNYALLHQLEDLRVAELPILAGLSRKSVISKVLRCQPSEALNGSTTLHTIALLNGANILRVHDVKEAVEALRLVEYYKGFEDCL
ncbi:MAG: dihydropteroate synthase [Bacteroidales bacterium]|nr:dihydropteroate synthase [Bacteroidales bacterium]